MPAPTQQPKAEANAHKTQQNQPAAPGASPEFVTPLASFAKVRELPVTPTQVMHLQRWAGNQAVLRILNRNTAQAESRPASPLLQTKLIVGAADDRYEREADQIARSVIQPVRAPEQEGDEVSTSGAVPPKIHRVQRQARVGRAGGEVGGDLDGRLRQSQRGGRAMPAKVRSAIEPKLGADLSSVKVHTGSDSVQLNRELGAKAFTHGNHIFYGAVRRPTTSSSLRTKRCTPSSKGRCAGSKRTTTMYSAPPSRGWA